MRNIKVSETGNPTPDTSQDYCAVFDDYDGAPDAGHQCMGMGRTKREAILHLKDCCHRSMEELSNLDIEDE